MPEAAADISCRAAGPCGLITLARPQALNALTLDMVRAIAAALDAWEHDPAIARVVIQGSGGRAFCAGGDIRLLHAQGRAGDHAAQLAFWADEYRLNLRIKQYPKPYIALVDGIVMGGGVGVSLHGSHVVAGDGFAFAMPEAGIGFFPDVGATHFLPRLPGMAGTRLALTGARVGADEALALGLVDAHVPGDAFAAVAHRLVSGDDVGMVLAPFAAKPASARDAALDACFAGDSVGGILARLEALGSPDAAALKQKSPTSLAIALRQMRDGAGLGMRAAMELEFAIVSRLCRGHDFYEGVRALVLDKDQRPQWQPVRIADVDPAEIDRHFQPLARGLFDGGAA